MATNAADVCCGTFYLGHPWPYSIPVAQRGGSLLLPGPQSSCGGPTARAVAGCRSRCLACMCCCGGFSDLFRRFGLHSIGVPGYVRLEHCSAFEVFEAGHQGRRQVAQRSPGHPPCGFKDGRKETGLSSCLAGPCLLSDSPDSTLHVSCCLADAGSSTSRPTAGSGSGKKHLADPVAVSGCSCCSVSPTADRGGKAGCCIRRRKNTSRRGACNGRSRCIESRPKTREWRIADKNGSLFLHSRMRRRSFLSLCCHSQMYRPSSVLKINLTDRARRELSFGVVNTPSSLAVQ
mmetsp:Transcript_9242/g.18087  ORF Transcript_9242/g.18087 Transcript_9242/m.18087 type:complete len:290 (+) Transcript_9242:636-1505(+)